MKLKPPASIRARLGLATLLILTLFLVLTAVALEQAMYKRAWQAQNNQLENLIYNLLASIEPNADGRLQIDTGRLFNERLMTPSSGLYARLLDADDSELWRSDSLLNDGLPIPQTAIGQWLFSETQSTDGKDYFRLVFGFSWPDQQARMQRYTLMVFEDASTFSAEMAQFRNTLWLWLSAVTFFLMLVIVLVVNWGLKPVRLISAEIHAMENGERDALSTAYPVELQPLAQNLNALLVRERAQLQRYRHALADLAHSLKTPLAVLSGMAQSEAQTNHTLQEQTERMNQIVAYQLKRASAAGGGVFNSPLELQKPIEKTVRALRKAWSCRGVDIGLHIEPGLRLRIDEGDLMEIVGNLLDNACKYGSGQVLVQLRHEQGQLHLCIEDNGPGVAADQAESLLQRGQRLDQKQEGQGIGLAVVAEIVAAYEASVHFQSSKSLGGTQVLVSFPSALVANLG